MNDTMTGYEFKARRRIMGLTLADATGLIGIKDRRTLQRWESSPEPMPEFAADAMDARWDDWIGELGAAGMPTAKQWATYAGMADDKRAAFHARLLLASMMPNELTHWANL